jgi:hypothetical protein
MASIEERVQALEQQVAGMAAAPAAPTGPAGRLAAAAKAVLAWAGAELPKFLSAAVLLVFGWGIKDSVDLSIKQRQLDLSYAKEMQSLLQKMSDREADFGTLESTAVVLSSFGPPALPALLSELRYTGGRGDAANAGLAALALTHRSEVCQALPPVMASRAQQYDWKAHQRVVRLLGVNSCRDALAPLQRYRSLVAAAVQGQDVALRAYLRAAPNAPTDDYPQLLETVDASLGLLKSAAAEPTPKETPR